MQSDRKRSFEKVFKIEGLERKEFKGVEGYMSQDNSFFISPDLLPIIENINPTPTLSSINLYEEKKFLVKDQNKKNWNYDLKFVDEVFERFHPIYVNPPELLCQKAGLLFLIWRYGTTIVGALIAPINDLFLSTDKEIVEKMEEHLEEAYKFFGIKSSLNKELRYDEIKEILESLNEDQVINKVVIPILNKLEFKNIKRIAHHGQGEAGCDIQFSKESALGGTQYSVAQVKAEKIHANSSVNKGNVNTAINEIKEALRTPREFQKVLCHINDVFLICSKEVTPDAHDQLSIEFGGNPHVQIRENNWLIENIIKYHIDIK